MSYDDYDPYRTSGGQFTNLGGASTGDQWIAGVGHGDSYGSANAKVEMYRDANNLDRFTGLPKPHVAGTGFYSGGGSYSGGGGATDDGEDTFFPALWAAIAWIMKWLVAVPALLAVVAYACWYGLKAADTEWLKQSPTGGFIRLAVAQTFAHQELAPSSSYIAAKDMAGLLDAPALLKVLRNTHHHVDEKDPKNLRLLASAYHCQVDDACRSAALSAQPQAREDILGLAVTFLLVQAKAGSPSAEQDICLLPLKAGPVQGAAAEATTACRWAATQLPHSATVRATLTTLEGSAWMAASSALASKM